MMASDDRAAANADQAVFWNSAPGLGWVVNEAPLDELMAGVLDRLVEVAAPRPGEAVLDVGCGTGASTLALAAAVAPGGRVVGADISGQMLARAGERVAAAGASGVELVVADAQTHRFAPGGFDLAVSRFGLMFFADPVAAFGNLRRALRPGGRLAFAAWGPVEANPWFVIPRAAAVARMGPVPADPPGTPGPFGLASLGRGLDILERAGFAGRRARTETLTLGFAAGAAAAGALAINTGPAVRILRDRGGTPEDAAAIAGAVAAELAPYVGADGGLRVPAAVNIFEAVQPG